MYSVFGKNVDLDNPLLGHPNPYFERKDYLLLNGKWEFEITKSRTLTNNYSKSIIVPFSPETSLSGVEQAIKGDDYMHYRRLVLIPNEHIGKRMLLNFEAVDQKAWVYVNGRLLGEHEGGYLPFSFMVDGVYKKLEIQVVVKDDTDSPIYGKGKQTLKPNTIWYTATSGIWGSVYLEFLPKEYIQTFEIHPDYDKKQIEVVFAEENERNGHLKIYSSDQLIYENGISNGLTKISLKDDFKPWSTDEPNLYEAVLEYGDDEVRTRFAFRKISIEEKEHRKFFLFNDEPLYLSALLDQGYFPESGLTPPSIEAIEADILMAKKAGFNCLRKHIKVEPLRFYYACDRLGMLVSQDMVNNGGPYKLFLIASAPFIPYKIKDKPRKLLGSSSKDACLQFEKDMVGTISYLKNVPSIVAWTIFNEGWGQFDSLRMLSLAKGIDDSRPFDLTSGWFDQGGGDYYSKHVYFRAPKMKNDHKRLLSLSEFGGYSCAIKGHTYSDKEVGYKRFADPNKMSVALLNIFKQHLERLIKEEALSCSVLTQLTDVENEINGLITYDRAVVKIDVDAFKEENEKLRELYRQTFYGK